MSSCKAHAILSDFKKTSVFSVYFRKVERHQCGPGSSFGTTTDYGLDGPG